MGTTKSALPAFLKRGWLALKERIKAGPYGGTRRVIEESWPPSIYLDSIASDEWPVCASIFREETPTRAVLVGTGPEAVAEEVGWIDARCPGSSRFRGRLAKGKDQFLEFGFGYLFRSSRPWKPLRHALVHFWPVFALASDPHWKDINPA